MSAKQNDFIVLFTVRFFCLCKMVYAVKTLNSKNPNCYNNVNVKPTYQECPEK